MQSANNPISHHTSHTMGQGAASSNGGDNRSGGSCVDHHTNHSIDATSSDSVALGGDGVVEVSDGETGDDQGCVLETSVTGLDVNELHPIATTISNESENSDSASDGRSSGATSVHSIGNLNNFSIIDTTLREGEQFATAYFDTATKIKIAQALDDIGVEYIELTSPASSMQSRLDCQAICKLGLKAKILCHIRCNMDDARIAVETGVDGINMCIGTSTQLMKHSHGKDLDWIAAKAKEVIEFTQAHGLEVRFSGEDSFRSDFNEILKLYSLMDRLGAHRVGIADTVGGASSREVFEKIHMLRQMVGCDIETHFHDDTGCAVANAYTALEAGATHIDTTVLGIGERNGITSLSKLLRCMLQMKHEYVSAKYKLDKLPALEQLVAEAVGIQIPWNNPSLRAFL
ncbi:probable homocitrate synthase, mitochondrial precursor [Fusarium torulosum]|uniref:Probable homocitrate synthase, mitochondrial n=1 Tax=Fusarium torulosum TaxID=33205 RepID=A0AAE8SHX4_9HYPO|nr:probable homocitrate synthase, mitochondrial precursor [Fusarium torulosum]